jgi:Na+-driven multidrug efflux pump
MSGLMDGHRRFLNMMNDTTVSFYCLISGVAIHISCLYYFVILHNCGIQGLGYAGSIANTTVYTVIMLYSYLNPTIRQAMKLPDRRTF